MAASMAVVLRDARSGKDRPFSPHPKDGAALAATLTGVDVQYKGTHGNRRTERTNGPTNRPNNRPTNETDGRETDDGRRCYSRIFLDWTTPWMQRNSEAEKVRCPLTLSLDLAAGFPVHGPSWTHTNGPPPCPTRPCVSLDGARSRTPCKPAPAISLSRLGDPFG